MNLGERIKYVRNHEEDFVETSAANGVPRFTEMFGEWESAGWWIKAAARKHVHRYLQAKFISEEKGDIRWMGQERYILTDEELTNIRDQRDCRVIANAEAKALRP